MKRWFASAVAIFCVASCATVAIVGGWPARRVRTADNNGDGRPDVWRLYDGKGQLTEVDVDSNFDGHTDIQEYYCSPSEQENYNKLFGNAAGTKGAP